MVPYSSPVGKLVKVVLKYRRLSRLFEFERDGNDKVNYNLMHDKCKVVTPTLTDWMNK